MSTHLLPVKRGDEQIEVSYRNYNTNSLYLKSCVCTNSHKMLYICIDQYNSSDVPNSFHKIFKLNLITGSFDLVGSIPWNDIGSAVGSILVDDSRLYISSITSAKIVVFDLTSLQKIFVYQYNATAFRAYGKMQWIDEETICCLYDTGILKISTNPMGATFTALSMTTSSDFAVGKKLILANKKDATTNSLFVYNISTNTGAYESLTSNAVAVSCYENGKFYIANNASLMIYDEDTATLERTIVTRWGAPRGIMVSKGTVVVFGSNSNRVFIYDTNVDMERYVIAPWTIPAWNDGYTFVPSATLGLYYIPYITMCQIAYDGYTKYNFGPKYSQFAIFYNLSTENQFTYNPDFVEFTDSYVTVKDGYLTIPFETLDSENHIKVAHVSKSDYNVMKRSSLIKVTQEEGE